MEHGVKRYFLLICNATISFSLGASESEAVFAQQLEVEEKTENNSIKFSEDKNLSQIVPPVNVPTISNRENLPLEKLDVEESLIEFTEALEIDVGGKGDETIQRPLFGERKRVDSDFCAERLEIEEKSDQELLKIVDREIAQTEESDFAKRASEGKESTRMYVEDDGLFADSLDLDLEIQMAGHSPQKIVENQQSEISLNDSTSHAIAAQIDRDYPPPPTYSFLPKRVDFRHVQGSSGGVGFGTDYSTAALLFATEYKLGHIMPMLDLRVHRFDNNTYAANAGVAARYLPPPDSFCKILGFNLFYDYRQGFSTHRHYNQIGAGIEVLGRRWDFRANCYYPVGNRKHQVKCIFDDFDGGFVMIHRKCEGVSYGYNAEVGYLLTGEKPFLLYAAAGPYYMARKCHSKTVGGEVRLRPQYKDYLALDLRASYDSVFKAVYQLQVIVTLPFYQILSKKNKRGPCGMSDRQVYQPIERFEVSPLGKRSCWQANF